MKNDGKGNFGMFSRVGIQTTEKFHILTKKDQILTGKTNRAVKSRGVYDPEHIVTQIINNINNYNIRNLIRISNLKSTYLIMKNFIVQIKN